MTDSLDWRADANCATTDPDQFFAGSETTIRTRMICHTCPVMEQCRTYGIANEPEWGLYGGLTPKERRRIRKDGAA